MNREIKFRGWDGLEFIFMELGAGRSRWSDIWNCGSFKYVEQYTGLKDKNGVEIYEHSEIDKKFIVLFVKGSYVLHDISNEIIFNLYSYYENNNGQIEISRERSEVA